MNVYKPLTTFATAELAKIGIPARIIEVQPINDGDYVLLTFDYEKAFDFSKLVPAMLSMRKKIAEQELQLFSDFVFQFDPHAKIVEQIIIIELVLVKDLK